MNNKIETKLIQSMILFFPFLFLILFRPLSFVIYILILQRLNIDIEKCIEILLTILSIFYSFLIGFFFKEAHSDETEKKLNQIIKLLENKEITIRHQPYVASMKERNKKKVFSAFLYSLILQVVLFWYAYIVYSGDSTAKFSILNIAFWILLIVFILGECIARICIDNEKIKLKALSLSFVLKYYGSSLILVSIMHNYLNII